MLAKSDGLTGSRGRGSRERSQGLKSNDAEIAKSDAYASHPRPVAPYAEASSAPTSSDSRFT